MSHELRGAEEVIARQTPQAQVMIRALLARISELEARRAEQEARFKKTPRSSSLPPSTDQAHAKPMPARPKSSRKPGGQSGHAKYERPLIPVEQCTDVVPLKPTACRRCGTTLSGSDPKPLRHQVWELPEIKPLVTEYQRQRLVAPVAARSRAAPCRRPRPMARQDHGWWRGLPC